MFYCINRKITDCRFNEIYEILHDIEFCVFIKSCQMCFCLESMMISDMVMVREQYQGSH